MLIRNKQLETMPTASLKVFAVILRRRNLVFFLAISGIFREEIGNLPPGIPKGATQKQLHKNVSNHRNHVNNLSLLLNASVKHMR